MPSAKRIERGNVVVAQGRATNVGDLADAMTTRLRAAGWSGSPVAILSGEGTDLVAGAAVLASTGTPGALLYDDLDGRRAAERLAARGLALFDAGAGTLRAATAPSVEAAGSVTLMTSGTTGEPKPMGHTWDSLRTWRPSPESAGSGSDLRWLITYRPGSYAWYQVVVLALFSPGQGLVLGAGLDPIPLLEAARKGGATAVSSTPTFWRWALLNARADQLDLPLRQVSLGGERVDQAILDRLHALYPSARLTHIYASTEAGASLVVNDGREGFPLAWLERDLAGGRVQVKVEGATLHIHSAHAATGHSGWIDTGDLVEVRGDRILILGRAASAFVNVGGARAVLPDIERALLEHPAVAWCRVSGRRAPVVGTMLAAEVVLRHGQSATEADLTAFLRSRMAEALVPRFFRFRSDIPMTSNQKSALAPP